MLKLLASAIHGLPGGALEPFYSELERLAYLASEANAHRMLIYVGYSRALQRYGSDNLITRRYARLYTRAGKRYDRRSLAYNCYRIPDPRSTAHD